MSRIDMSIWQPAPRELKPDFARVDVWRIATDLPTERIEAFARLLTTDEIADSCRFRMQHKRNEYTIARGLVRQRLGELLQTDPCGLAFQYGPHGKPRLPQSDQEFSIGFNVSHSGNWILLAIATSREVGIDVEKIRPEIECDQMAQRYFSAQEVQTLLSLHDSLRRKAFFRCWTRKEAIVKALGNGISLGLDRFDVSLRPDDPAALLESRWDADVSTDWTLLEVAMPTGYVAALTVSQAGFDVKCWNAA